MFGLTKPQMFWIEILMLGLMFTAWIWIGWFPLDKWFKQKQNDDDHY